MAKHTDDRAPRHPAADLVAGLHERLDDADAVSLLALDGQGTRSLLLELAGFESRVCALGLRVIAHAEDVDAAGEVGATTTARDPEHPSPSDPGGRACRDPGVDHAG